MKRRSRIAQHRSWLAPTAFAVGLALSSVPALGQASADHLSAAELFALAEQAKEDGRVEDAEAIYDALQRDADADVRAEARFRAGMMLADARRYREAAAMFRALLDEKPDAAGVRLELARMLAAMGDEGAARRAIRQAQATGLPDDVSLTVEQFARILRSDKKFGGSFEFALAPDSNINRATQARTLDTVIAPLTLSEDARRKSGVGIRLSGQAFMRLAVGSNLAVTPRLATSATLYGASAFNDISASALLGLERRTESGRLNFSAGQTWRWFGNSPYARTMTTSLDWLHPVGRQSQVHAHVGASRANYLTNDLQDGKLYDVALGIEKAVTPRSGFDVTTNAYRQTARDPGYATKSAGIAATAWQDAGKLTFITTAAVQRLRGDERLFLFPDSRREWSLRSSFTVTSRHIVVAGLAPAIRLVFEANESTVDLYDFSRKAVEFAVVRAF